MSIPENENRGGPCPVCGGTDLSNPFDGIEAVCGSCGIVVYEWDDPALSEAREKIRERYSSVQAENWSEIRPAHNSTQHRFSDAIEVIEQISDSLAISFSVRLTAAEIYVEAAVDGISKGRSVTTVAAACLHVAAKTAGEPRPLKRIADGAGTERTTLSKIVRCLYSHLSGIDGVENTIAAPEEYLEFLCSDLDLDDDLSSGAETILQTVREHVAFQGQHPAGVAAAAVYLTADSPPPQRKLAASAGVATETIRKRLNDFREITEGVEDV